MPSIDEEVKEHVGWRDEVEGYRLDLKNVELCLKQLIVRIRILVSVVLVLSMGTIIIWNFFPPTSKDVSDRVIVKLLKALNSKNVASLLVEEDSGRFSSTGTIPPHANT